MKKKYFGILNKNTPLFLKTILLHKLRFLAFIFLFFSGLTATYAQSCNVVKGGDFTGGISADWTSQNQATGWFHYNNQAYIELDGAINVSLKQSLTGLISGNSLVLKFDIKGQNAFRSGNGCSTSATLDIKIGNTTYMTITNPGSNASNKTQITVGNITVFAGASYTQTGFPITIAGSSEAALTKGVITLVIPWSPITIAATTADLEFLATTSASPRGTGTCSDVFGGDDWFLDNITLTASNPTLYNITGNNSCGGTNTVIGLGNSQLGVNYQLQIDGVNSGTPIAGTGSAISFGSKSAVGVYTVLATAGSTSCTTIMTGNVAVNPLPTLTGASVSTTPVCEGSGTVINLTGLLLNSTSTINYTINGVLQTPINGVVANGSGTASFTTPALIATNNNQILQITGVTTTSSTPNCSSSFTRNVTLLVRPTPTATISGTTTVCQSNTSPSIITFTNPLSLPITVTYSVNGVTAPTITVAANSNATVTRSRNTLGVFTYNLISAVYQSTPNCSATLTGSAVINVAGPVGIPSTPTPSASTICQGSTPTIYTTSATNATSYNWSVTGTGNSISGTGTTGTVTWAAGFSGSATISVTALGCGNSSPVSTTVIVRPTVTASISGTTTVCQSATSPNVTFTNSLSLPITVTYNINGGTASTISVGANATATVAAPTGTSGTFTYNLVSAVYQAAPTCSVNLTGSAVITVRPTVTASISGATTVCQNGTSPNVTFTNPINLPITVTYNINGGTASTVNVGANATATVGVPTGASGAFIYNLVSAVYQATPTCSANLTGSATVTVNSVTTPTAVVVTQPNCSVITGTITLSNLPPSGTIFQTISGVTTSFPVSGVGTQTISELAPGNYTFAVSNGSCTSAISNQVTIIAFSGTIAKWNGSDWSSIPTINDRVEFNGDYSSGSTPKAIPNVDACSCYINFNAKVVFNTDLVLNVGHTLNVLNEVVVNEGIGITASLTFEHKASLVQHNDVLVVPNKGKITYKRNTVITRYDYTYWSSPVAGQTLKQLSYYTLFDRYFSYDPVAATPGWQLSKSGVAVMQAGHGYIVRGPQNSSISVPATFEGIFFGAPNNGVVNGVDLAVVADKNYLLGNPYPSAIDADKFLALNSTKLQGTLYFWTHNTEPVAAAGTTTYKYTTNDYASYNGTGGVNTKPAKSGGAIPNGKIAAGQGFFAPTIGAGNVLFNNSMRLGATQTTYLDNSQFYKLNTAKTTAAAATEKSRVWLNLTNAEGVYKQALIGYVAGATNEYDNGFDGVSYNGNQYVDFYSVNQDKNLVIQGRALPFVKKDSVALGFNTTISGDFKINIDTTDGVLANQKIFLEDKDLKVLHDLKKEAYTFSTEKGTFNNRFVLRYKDKNEVDEVIVPEIPAGINDAVIVSVKDKTITINSMLTKLDRVVVYDVAGRKLFQKNKIEDNVLLIPHFVWSDQVLVVNILLSDGTKVARKIIN